MNTTPASKFQEQFWLLNQLSPKSAVYNIANLIALDGKPDHKYLEETFLEIIRKHDVLRTYFSYDGTVKQHVIPFEEIAFSIPEVVLDVGGIIENNLPKIIEDAVNQPFDLTKAPLLRIILFNNTATPYLLIVFHHIITDLHSKNIFEHDFRTIFKRKITQKEIVHLNPNKQYCEFSLWHNNWLTEKECLKMKEEWISELPPANHKINLPFDFERPKASSLSGERLYYSLSKETSEAIHRYAQANTSYSFLVLLTVYAVLLNKLTQQQSIVIGVPLTNRRTDEFKDTFGCFINIVPIHIDFSLQSTVSDIRKQIRHKLLMAHRKQEVPFLNLLDQNSDQRDPSYNPFYQVGFTNESLMNLKIDGIKTVPIPFNKCGSQLDLFLTFWELDDLFHIYLEYSTEIFKKETVLDIKQAFINFIPLVLENNKTKITELDHPILRKLKKKKHSKRAHGAQIGNNQVDDIISITQQHRQIIALLSEIWSEILGNKEVNTNSNFFDLGGNSLLAMELITVLKKKQGIVIELIDVLQHPNIKTMAKHILNIQDSYMQQ